MKTLATIYCPECGGEVPDKETVCPACGFDLDKYEENAEGDEFSELLDAANKRLSEENLSDSAEKTVSDAAADIPAGAKKVSVESLKQSAEEEMNSSAAQTVNADEPEAEIKTVDTDSGKKKKRKKKGVSPVLVTFLTVIVAAALGFCAAMVLFTDAIKTNEESFAIRAANALNSKLSVNQQLCVYKAYVRLGAGSSECVLYAVVDYDDSVTASVYRVVVEKDNPDIINIYYSIDEDDPDYIAMKNSSDPEKRIQASVLKNYSDGIEAACREIRIGEPSWVKTDISVINSSITSEQIRANS